MVQYQQTKVSFERWTWENYSWFFKDLICRWRTNHPWEKLDMDQDKYMTDKHILLSWIKAKPPHSFLNFFLFNFYCFHPRSQSHICILVLMKNPGIWISKCLNNEINEVFRSKDEKEDPRLNMHFASPWPEKFQIHLASFSMVSPPAIENRFEIMKLTQ